MGVALQMGVVRNDACAIKFGMLYFRNYFVFTMSAQQVIISFWVDFDLYVAFLGAIEKCSLRISSPLSTLKLRSA